jgi:membrane protein DedA with SNARE-associated domain
MPSLDSVIAFLQEVLAALRSGQLPELGYWTYPLLFVLVAFEGTFAILLGAAAASAGLMRPLPVFFTAAAGNLTADCLWYTLGYFGKTEWIYHFGRRLGVRPGLIERLKAALLKHATKVMFLAKVTSSFVIPALVTAGLLRIPFKRWFPYFIISETLWTGSLVLIGYYATESIKRVEQGLHYVLFIVPLIFVVFMLVAGRRLLSSVGADDTPAAPE